MNKHIETLVQRYPMLESCKDDILKAYQILEEAYSAGRKLLVAWRFCIRLRAYCW